MTKQKLMTKKIMTKIPKLYKTDGQKMKDRTIYVHYFCPLRNFDWFVYEYDQATKSCFGFTNLNDPINAELGYFNLQEFEELNKTYGTIIERDTGFQPATTEEVAKEYPVLKQIMDY